MSWRFWFGSSGSRLLLLFPYHVWKAVCDEEYDRREKPGHKAQRPVGRGYCQSERAGDPDRPCRFDALDVEAALEDHRSAEKADPGQEPLERPAN